MTPPIPQRTLAAAPPEIRGVGLFTAAPGALRILPAPPGTGLRFRRERADPFPATIAHLAPQPTGMPARNTMLAAAGVAPVVTVEHILSALTGLGITDAFLELEGPEIPIADGSAAPFAEAIAGVGIVEHGAGIAPLRIAREVTVEQGNARITATPREAGGIYRYRLDYGPAAPIAPQWAEWDAAAADACEAYMKQVAPARTFCLAAEAQAMRAAGLFTHLSPRDMLVIGEAGPIDNAYRFDDEPARHKLLDLIGDLALVGRPIAAEITAVRAGHALNHELARALLAAAC